MSYESGKHTAAVMNQGAQCDQWHESDMQAELSDIQLTAGNLEERLFRDVQPQDIRIGGIAVCRALYRDTDAYYDLGPTKTAEAAVEYWARKDDVAVCVSRQGSWTDSAKARLFARQARDVWTNIPGVSERRTRTITEAVRSADGLTVELYDASDLSAPQADEQILSLRRVVDSDSGNSRPRAFEYITSREPALFTPGQILGRAKFIASSNLSMNQAAKDMGVGDQPLTLFECAELAIKSYELQPRATPSEGNMRSAIRHVVHNKLAELSTTANNLQHGLDIVRQGKRMRLSRPYHSIPDILLQR